MRIRRFLAAIIVLTMVLSQLPVGNVYAADEKHIITNQVYGGAEDGYASHSFIELYNPTDEAVDLNGWSIQYKSSVDGGASDEWQKLELTGWIGAGDYYLVRCRFRE